MENLINKVPAGWEKRYLDQNNKNSCKIFFALKHKQYGGSLCVVVRDITSDLGHPSLFYMTPHIFCGGAFCSEMA